MKTTLTSVNFGPRLWALIISSLLIIPSAVLIAAGNTAYVLLAILGIVGVLVLLRYPEISMTILFPLIWLFWAYYVPWLGGRLERAIGVLAIAGVLISLLNKRKKRISLPPLTLAGMGLLFGAYLLSSVLNSAPNPEQYLISLGTRLLFLFLAFYLLSEPHHLRLAGILLIVTGMIGAGIILYWNVVWGLGFFRTYEGHVLAVSSLGSFWYTLLLGGNSLIITAVLLLGLFPSLHRPVQRYLVLLGAGFLFAMAFVSQFRREILISALFVLMYLIITNSSGLRKAATGVLLGLSVFYFFVLQPSDIFQQRMSEFSMLKAGTDPRLISLGAGLNAILQSPLWGSGPSSYERVAYRVLGSSYSSVYYHAYNVFIYFTVEAGFLGLAGLLLTLYGVFSATVKQRADPDTPQGWIISSAPALMIVISVSFLFGNATETSLPWYIFGLILSANRMIKESIV